MTIDTHSRMAVFVARFDTVTQRIANLARILPSTAAGDELRELSAELERLRRDLDTMSDVDLAEPPVPPRVKGGHSRTGGTQMINGVRRMPPAGMRWCANHDDGVGAMLPVASFKIKNKTTGQYASWCIDCARGYQQDRYVRLGYKRVTVEIVDGDACIGHLCRLCNRPFSVGQSVQGSDIVHEACADWAAAQSDTVLPSAHG